MARKKKSSAKAEILSFLALIGLGLSALTAYQAQDLWVGVFLFVSIFIVLQLVRLLMFYAEQEKVRKSGIDQVDRMNGVQFEEFLMLLYKDYGYKVKGTPKSGDFGADLIIEKSGQRIAVQAKRYSKPVGVKAVQEVHGSVNYYNCTAAWCVTNNNYTAAAKKLAEKNGVRLVDRKELINLILNKKNNRTHEKPA